MNKEYWFCFIGPKERKNICGDYPLRQAVKHTYEKEIGLDYDCASGWGVSEIEIELFSRISNLKLIVNINVQTELIDKINKDIILIQYKYGNRIYD